MRTLEQSLARAESLRDFRKTNGERFERNDDFIDIVNLADALIKLRWESTIEIERLRSDGLTSALDVGAEMGAIYKERDKLKAQLKGLGTVPLQRIIDGDIIHQEDHDESW